MADFSFHSSPTRCRTHRPGCRATRRATGGGTARQAQAAVDLATRRGQSRRATQSQNLAQLAARCEAAPSANQTAAQKDTAVGTRQPWSGHGSLRQLQHSTAKCSLLSDSSPFLLFPVRIETRFRTHQCTAPAPGTPASCGRASQTAHQLLVRIYPDDCSIDTFEPMLSQSELTNVKSLLDEHLARRRRRKRSTWRMEQAWSRPRVPDAPAGWSTTFSQSTCRRAAPRPTQPMRFSSFPTDTPLSAADAAAISTYWQNVWLADGDAAKISRSECSLDRSRWARPAPPISSPLTRHSTSRDTPAAPLTKTSRRAFGGVRGLSSRSAHHAAVMVASAAGSPVSGSLRRARIQRNSTQTLEAVGVAR